MTAFEAPEALDTVQPVKVALYGVLTGDSTLIGMLAPHPRPGAGKIGGVYDGAPEGATYPYVDLGEAIETARNRHGGYGADVVVTLHVWSEQRGYKEGLDIVARLRRLLDHRPLTVEGHQVVSVRHEQTLTLRDPNPELRHLPVRFRITTEQE